MPQLSARRAIRIALGCSHQRWVRHSVAGFYPRLWVRHQTCPRCLPVVHLRRAVMLPVRSATGNSLPFSVRVAACWRAGIRGKRQIASINRRVAALARRCGSLAFAGQVAVLVQQTGSKACSSRFELANKLKMPLENSGCGGVTAASRGLSILGCWVYQRCYRAVCMST